MSMLQEHRPVLDGDTLEKSHERILATASLSPRHEDMLFDGLTEDGEARILDAIAGE
ncbi:hypothetical protein BH24ACT5_BH24ACT5_30490 [soil metagenome]